jgi:endo-1,4-beta-xylanase
MSNFILSSLLVTRQHNEVPVLNLQIKLTTMKKMSRTMNALTGVFSVPVLLILMISFSGCGNSGTGSNKAGAQADTTKGLKDYYKKLFPIGVAVSPRSLEGPTAKLILKNFNSLTCENVMKPAPIHPEESRYYWDDADKIVNFAQSNGLKLRGHTLCWHSQVGPWMFVDSLGNTVTKEVLLARLKDHITEVVTRYKGKVYAWDVLNEAIDDDSTKFFRESQWYRICGEDFIAKAFQWAHEADPDAVLFYNDYNTEDPQKRDRIYTFLKKLLDAKVPVHAIGLQGHWNTNNPTEKNLRAAIDKFSSLGLKVQITELDVNIYTSRNDTTNVGFTPEREQKQIDQYKMIFRVFRDYKKVITGVTFWNVTDANSWLDRRPPMAGKKYPLLFDVNMKPKKAFWEVAQF